MDQGLRKSPHDSLQLWAQRLVLHGRSTSKVPRCQSLWQIQTSTQQVWTIFRNSPEKQFSLRNVPFFFWKRERGTEHFKIFWTKIAQLSFDKEKANQNQPIWTPTILIVLLPQALFFGSSCVVASWSHMILLSYVQDEISVQTWRVFHGVSWFSREISSCHL